MDKFMSHSPNRCLFFPSIKIQHVMMQAAFHLREKSILRKDEAFQLRGLTPALEDKEEN